MKCLPLLSLIVCLGFFASPAHAADTKPVTPYKLSKCFLSDHDLDADAVVFTHEGREIKLCCKDCKAEFDKDPAKALAKLTEKEKAAGAKASPFENVNAAQFEKLRSDKDAVVLDVRTKDEFAAGHVPGAVNLDVKASDFAALAAKLDKSKTYLVHCAAGVRSVKACNELAPLKFEKLYNLEGGLRAWEKAGYKTVK